MYYIVIYIYVLVLPHDFFGNQTTAHPVVKVCVAVSLASHAYGRVAPYMLQLRGDLLSLHPFGKRLYVNPGFVG